MACGAFVGLKSKPVGMVVAAAGEYKPAQTGGRGRAGQRPKLRVRGMKTGKALLIVLCGGWWVGSTEARMKM